MNLYQFHTHPKANAVLLPDKQIRNVPKFAVQAMARCAYENGVRNVPVDIDAKPDKEILLLTDWLNYSYSNWQDLRVYTLAMCAEYTYRFSTEDDKGITYDKSHPAAEELHRVCQIYVSNVGENGSTKWPCFLVDYASEVFSSYLQQMRLTYAVSDSAKAKWTRREKPGFINEYAEAYNDYMKRLKDRAKMKAKAKKSDEADKETETETDTAENES